MHRFASSKAAHSIVSAMALRDEKRRINGGTSSLPREQSALYDVRTEKVRDVFHHEIFQKAFGDAQNLSQENFDFLSKVDAAQSDKGLAELRRRAEELKNFQIRNSLKVAVMGDTGVGKSSTLNSLLHSSDNICAVAETGEASTKFPIENHQLAPYHSAKFHVEVDLKTRTEAEDFVRELFQDFQKPLRLEKANDEHYDELSQDSQNAWDILTTIFREHFESGELAEQQLGDTSEAESKHTLELLIKWTRELRWIQENRDASMCTVDAHTADELLSSLEKFNEGHISHLISVMRIYQDSHILRQGIVLADVPGFRDTNMARMRLTEEYLGNCDYVFIVAGIIRAVSDVRIREAMFKLLRRTCADGSAPRFRRRLPFSIICTSSDLINNQEVLGRDLSKQGLVDKNLFQTYKRAIEDATLRDDKDDCDRLGDQRRSLLIKGRNKMTTHRIRKAYDEYTSDLDVFCVSNTIYSSYVKTGDTAMVEISGIPELRGVYSRKCRTKTAESCESFHQAQAPRPPLVKPKLGWRSILGREYELSILQDCGRDCQRDEDLEEKCTGKRSKTVNGN